MADNTNELNKSGSLAGADGIEPNTEEVKVEEVKTEEPKTEEPKTEEVKDEEVNTEEPNTEEPKTEEVTAEDVKAEESKSEEDKPKEVKVEKPKPKNKPFIHLHVHTEMSLLDGAAKITKGKKSPLMQACKDKNFPAIAITDHGNMYGVFTFQKKAIEYGVKPILGCELYICDDMHAKTDKCFDHILLIAKDNVGYKNLVKLDSLAYTEGFYYKPRIDWDFLAAHAEGIICTTACIGGTVPQLLLDGKYDEAKAMALRMKSMFADGDFYIELQNHGIKDELQVMPLLYKLAKEIGVKVVATNDVHYIEKADAEAHDVLLCIQTGKNYDDPKRMHFEGDSFYLKTYEEMEELFAWCPEALETPFEIADKCNAKIEKHNLIPSYEPSDGTTPPEFLRKLAMVGLVDRYGELTDEIKERAEYELDVIISLGYAEYYLIVWDFIDYAKRNDIPVGAGRGSGVSSIIAYAIGITNVDPLRYNLLFERFLNRERVSMPDFDIDFCVEGRGKVIEYVIEKYGAEKVCQILAMGTMAAKNAIKDVARVFQVPLAEVNALTKMIPNGKVHLEDVLGMTEKTEYIVPEVIEAYRTNELMHKVLDLAIKLEGMPRNCSKHAAGVVICREVISDFVPLSKTGEDIVTQFQKDEVEEVGMLKMDFLGLRTLTDIDKAKHYIYDTTGDVVDFEKLGYSDPKVYQLISSAETDAVFQLESPGMKKFMKDLQPQSLEDIIAGISLYRPGPMDSIPQYVESKNNPEKITYDNEMLVELLDMTYGCIVYQEQVMQIVQKLAGYTLGGADILRRIMGKKKEEEMIVQRAIFLNGSPAKEAEYKDGELISPAVPAFDGALKRGVPEDAAIIIFDKMAAFAKYAFNKSHAAAYAVVAYETGYLKSYYPVQFIAAVINNRITNADEVAKYVEYMRETGVKVLPPDINISEVYFTCENGGMRFGLMGIKNVGEAAITALVLERKTNGAFKNLTDMIKRTDGNGMNKRLIESLIKSGALDCFGANRTTMIGNYERIMLSNSYDKKMKQKGQFSMFDAIEVDEEDKLEFLKDKPRNDLLIEEKEVMNIYMSGHPLDEYRSLYLEMPFNLSLIKLILDSEKETAQDAELADESETNETFELVKQYDKKIIELGGMISDIRIRVTKTSKSMCMARLEDLHSSIDIVFFPSSYDRFKALIVKDNIVRVKGELQVAGGRSQIVVKDIKPWKIDTSEQVPAINEVDELPMNIAEEMQSEEIQPKAIFINGTNKSEDELNEIIEQLLLLRDGAVPCFIQHKGKMLDSKARVLWCSSTKWSLSNIVGVNNFKAIDK